LAFCLEAYPLKGVILMPVPPTAAARDAARRAERARQAGDQTVATVPQKSDTPQQITKNTQTIPSLQSQPAREYPQIQSQSTSGFSMPGTGVLWTMTLLLFIIALVWVQSLYLASIPMEFRLLISLGVVSLFSKYLYTSVSENEQKLVVDPLTGSQRTIQGPGLALILLWEDVSAPIGSSFSTEVIQSVFTGENPTADQLRMNFSSFIAWKVVDIGQYNRLGATAKVQVEKVLRSLFKNYTLKVSFRSGESTLLTGDEILLNLASIIGGFRPFLNVEYSNLRTNFGIEIVNSAIEEVDYSQSSQTLLDKRGQSRLETGASVQLVADLNAEVERVLGANATSEQKTDLLQTLLAVAKPGGLTKNVTELSIKADPVMTALATQIISSNPRILQRINAASQTRNQTK
jgi:SPFH domain / Band 7 family